jgi:HAD superfamily hydrolase (TIGR01509 family)
MKLRAALFDFDGTIFQIEILHQAIMKQVIEEYTKTQVDEDELRASVGIPYGDRLTHMLAMRGIDDDKLVEQLTKYAVALLEKQPEQRRALVPGVVAMFDQLRAAGVKMAVVSSATHPRLEKELAETGLRPYFEFVIGRDDVSAHKPHPEPYETALHKLGMQAKETIAFEDSPPGLESAWLAGITVVGLLTTFYAEDLGKASKLIHNFEGLTINDLDALL